MKRTILCALALALGACGCAGPGRHVSQYDLGMYMKSQGKPDEALKAFQASLSLAPDDPTPREALAQAYFDRGWRAQAVQEWERALSDSSEDPAFYAPLV